LSKNRYRLRARRVDCPAAALRAAAWWLRLGALRLHVDTADVSLRRKTADLPAANAGLTGQPLPAECLVASARRVAPSHRRSRCEPAPQGCRFACGKCWPLQASRCTQSALWLRPGALRLHVGEADMSLRRKAADLPAANAGLYRPAAARSAAALSVLWSAFTSLARY